MAAVSFTMVARDVEDYSKVESIIMNVKECIGTSIGVRAWRSNIKGSNETKE